MPAAKIAAGNTGPSNREVPVKLRYLLEDINRWAARYELPVNFPASLNSTRMNVGTFVAIERNQARQYVDAGFSLGWGEGADIGTDATLGTLAERMGWPVSEFLQTLSAPEENDQFVASNNEAHERGVFGVPTMLIGTHMWWGNDRLEFLDEFLADKDIGIRIPSLRTVCQEIKQCFGLRKQERESSERGGERQLRSLAIQNCSISQAPPARSA